MSKQRLALGLSILIVSTVGLYAVNKQNANIQTIQNTEEIKLIQVNVREGNLSDRGNFDRELYASNVESLEIINCTENIDLSIMELPWNATGKFKSFMDYRTITDKSSKQYRIQQESWTDNLGFRRYNEDYCVAMGTYYAVECGKRFNITLETGLNFNVVVADIKQDIHTDATHRFVPKNGNIIEFIVDKYKINKESKSMGNMEFSGMNGTITCIRILK